MQLQPQRILSKSPLRTQAHSIPGIIPYQTENPSFNYQYRPRNEEEIWKFKSIDLEKRLEAYYQQNQELKSLINDYQNSLHNYKGQLEEQLILNSSNLKQIKELTDFNEQLTRENNKIGSIVQQQDKEIEMLKNSTQHITDDFNKQFEGTLKSRIENDIKEIHNKYLREIQQLKSKLFELEKQKQGDPRKMEELLQGIESKNNYIDDILIKYAELDEECNNLKQICHQNTYQLQQRDILIEQLAAELEGQQQNKRSQFYDSSQTRQINSIIQ